MRRERGVHVPFRSLKLTTACAGEITPERGPHRSANENVSYFSPLPAVSPVFGLTKCSRPHAWQITPSYLSPSSD
jgi:hypothetical protein